jgi:3,4-dihydroxy 2-butanone 4-phosphate synthase / GTP cyclohydrolase II
VTFDSIDSAVEAFARGEPLVVVDDEDRENEGDLILAADQVTADAVAFMVRYTSGLICVPLTGERLDALELPLMVAHNSESMRTAFTVTVDARVGTTTGVSAADRATTIRALVDVATQPSDLARPGHVFPLRAQPGGVLTRRGHTEAAIELARLSGQSPAGVLAEITNADGSMARRPQLEDFATEHGLRIITIADLVNHRQLHDTRVDKVAVSRLPTEFGDFTAYAFESRLDGIHHLALVRGDVATGAPVLVRVHSECLSGDVFGSRRCDCGEQLQASLRAIGEAGRGVVVYLRGHEGRGIGLASKLRAYALQDQGLDTVDANLRLGLPVDAREYAGAADILRYLSIKRIRLLTNNPRKCTALVACGLDVVERVPLLTSPTADNLRYLRTKQQRMGHLLENV